MKNKANHISYRSRWFIGYHLCEALLKAGHDVSGLDNINDYYDVNLKYARLQELGMKEQKLKYLGRFQKVPSITLKCSL